MNTLQQISLQIKEKLCLPEGSIVFDFYSEDFFDKTKLGGKLLEVVSGKHLFILERTNDFKVNFIHSSPGTRTRLAQIDLNLVEKATQYMFCVTWSTKEISLNIGPRIEGGKLHQVTSNNSPFQLQVGEDGNIYEVENEMMKSMSLFVSGKPVVTATALRSWDETVSAIEVLLKKDSQNDYQFELVRSNIILSIIVTGFETYCKKRFLELEKEGIIPDTDKLIDKFIPKLEREKNIKETLIFEAKEQNITLLEYFVKRKFINFQNYDECKNAYNKTYNLIFGNLTNDADLFINLKKYIQFRHKIIHNSVMTGMLNRENVPPEEPIFPSDKTANEIIDTFKSFINLFHKATLSLTKKK